MSLLNSPKANYKINITKIKSRNKHTNTKQNKATCIIYKTTKKFNNFSPSNHYAVRKINTHTYIHTYIHTE